MSKILNSYVDSFESLPYSFENQKKRMSFVGFMPQQCNANSALDKDGIERTWFQVAGLYESSYDRKDENGELHSQDNSTIKTLIVKFKADHLKKYGVSTSMLKDFLTKNYVGKKMLVLPTTEEKQSTKKQGDNKVIPVLNQTECVVLEDFDLYLFIGLGDKSVLENKKA